MKKQAEKPASKGTTDRDGAPGDEGRNRGDISEIIGGTPQARHRVQPSIGPHLRHTIRAGARKVTTGTEVLEPCQKSRSRWRCPECQTPLKVRLRWLVQKLPAQSAAFAL